MSTWTLKTFLQSRWVIALLALSLLFMLRIQYQQWQKRKAVTAEIDQIKQQEASWQQKNKDLEESLAYLTTAGYKEHIAREQLNLKKDGEIVMSNGSSVDTLSTLEVGATVAVDGPTSHIEQWWKYFFKR